MKILVSSLSLSNALSEIDFQKEWVKEACLNGTDFYINTNLKAVKMFGVSPYVLRMHTQFISQANRRWDWVKNLVSKVDEQPIVLEITQDTVNVIFQY